MEADGIYENNRSKRGYNFRGEKDDYASYSGFIEAIESGQFLKLERQFLQKISKLNNIEKKELKYVINNRLYDLESKNSFWTLFALPSYIAIAAFFGSAYIAINSQGGVSNIIRNIFLIFSAVAPAVIVTIVMVKVSRIHSNNRNIQKFFSFYDDLIKFDD